jgi:hypothetical protein
LMTASLLQSLRKPSPNNEKHSQSVWGSIWSVN